MTKPVGRAGIILGLIGVVVALWFLAGEAAWAGVGLAYVVPAALAGAWLGMRAGVLTGLACGIVYTATAAAVAVDHLAVAAGVRTLLFVVAGVAGAWVAERSSRLDAAQRELDTMRGALAPVGVPELPDVDVASAFLPAEHGVSGDFFLVTNGPDDRLVAIVGDVVGHGLEAARLATFVRSKLAAYGANSADPAELLSMVNTDLMERGRRPREFVTAACVIYDRKAREVCWAAAGHPPPLRLRDGIEMAGGRRSLPLGIQAEMRPHANTVALAPEHDGLLLYTDGLVEARRGSEFFGLERVTRRLAELADRSARDTAAGLQQSVLDFCDGRLRDDVCVLVLRPRGIPTAITT